MPRQKDRVIIICEGCGGKFEVPKSRASLAKFCSTSCKYSNRKSENKIKKTCLVCGNEFSTYKSQDCDYCSIGCYNLSRRDRVEKECLNCGKKFEVKKSQSHVKCCSTSCGYDLLKKKISPQKYNRTEWRKTRLEVIKRDEGKCYFCGKKYKIGLHVHHKIPVKDGGKDEHGNLISLCKKCHVKLHKLISA